MGKNGGPDEERDGRHRETGRGSGVKKRGEKEEEGTSRNNSIISPRVKIERKHAQPTKKFAKTEVLLI